MGDSWRLLLPLKISLFQTANEKKSHVPEPLVSRPKALPAKRSEKGYGDENAQIVQIPHTSRQH